jgi:hypothetical protein
MSRGNCYDDGVEDDSDIIVQDVDIVHIHDADITSSNWNEGGGNLIHVTAKVFWTMRRRRRRR